MTYIFPNFSHFLFSENRVAKYFRPSPNPHLIGFLQDAAIWRHFETHEVQPPEEQSKEKGMFYSHLKHTLTILHLQVFALAVSDPDWSR